MPGDSVSLATGRHFPEADAAACPGGREPAPVRGEGHGLDAGRDTYGPTGPRFGQRVRGRERGELLSGRRVTGVEGAVVSRHGEPPAVGGKGYRGDPVGQRVPGFARPFHPALRRTSLRVEEHEPRVRN